MDRDDLEQYVGTLGDDVANLYRKTDQLVKEIGDTLCEDFQVAAAVLDVFEARAKAWRESKGW